MSVPTTRRPRRAEHAAAVADSTDHRGPNGTGNLPPEVALAAATRRARALGHTSLRIEELKVKGVRDFPQYFAAHPEFVQQAISMVKIVDVNDVTVKLFNAKSKDELLESLHRIRARDTGRSSLGS